MREPIILDQLLDRALRESDYHAKRAQFAARIREAHQARHGHRRFLSRLGLHWLRRAHI
jgi:hypothetical protein